MISQALDPARNDLRVVVRIDADARLVALAGEFDIAAVPLLLEGLAGLGRPGDITIDLTELSFIDAAGLAAAVQVRNTQRANGFDLHLVRASPLITRVFGLGGLAQMLSPAQ